jgi:hypothetical protein
VIIESNVAECCSSLEILGANLWRNHAALIGVKKSYNLSISQHAVSARSNGNVDGIENRHDLSIPLLSASPKFTSITTIISCPYIPRHCVSLYYLPPQGSASSQARSIMDSEILNAFIIPMEATKVCRYNEPSSKKLTISRKCPVRNSCVDLSDYVGYGIDIGRGGGRYILRNHYNYTNLCLCQLSKIWLAQRSTATILFFIVSCAQNARNPSLSQ